MSIQLHGAEWPCCSLTMQYIYVYAQTIYDNNNKEKSYRTPPLTPHTMRRGFKKKREH